MIAALERNGPNSLIIQALYSIGVTHNNLFRKWRRKSLHYIGKGEYFLHNYEESLNCFQESLLYIDDDDTSSLVECKDNISKATLKYKQEQKKLRSTWSKVSQFSKLICYLIVLSFYS